MLFISQIAVIEVKIYHAALTPLIAILWDLNDFCMEWGNNGT